MPENSKEKLEMERRRADEAVTAERSRVDTAIERGFASNSIGILLNSERRRIDHNLREERRQADTEAEVTSAQLTEAVLAHDQTKTELTTRNEFLAIVSHDLRNPIGTIASCATMLLEDDPTLAPESRQWIEMIKRNADSALRLIGDLLDMERFATGQLELRLQPCEAGSLLQETADNFAHAAEEKSISLRVEPSAEQIMVFVDRDRILQVLSNLAGNAIKFTPEGGSVLLRARKTGDDVEFKVSDSGPGVPAEKQRAIFEKFAQMGVPDRRGLGLGLYISKKLLEAHGGRIWVESTPGEGSVFAFAVPARTNFN